MRAPSILLAAVAVLLLAGCSTGSDESASDRSTVIDQSPDEASGGATPDSGAGTAEVDGVGQEQESSAGCDDIRAAADEELALFERGEGSETIEEFAMERYAELVLARPDCFDDDVVQGISMYQSQVDELDELDYEPLEVPTNPDAYWVEVTDVRDMGNGQVNVSGTVTNNDIVDHRYSIEYICTWRSTGEPSMPGGRVTYAATVRPGETASWGGFMSAWGGVDMRASRSLDCGLGSVRVG